MSSKEILTVEELAELLTVKPKTIRQWVFLKKIPFFHMGRLLRFRRESILEWAVQLEKDTQETPQPTAARSRGSQQSNNGSAAKPQRKRKMASQAGLSKREVMKG